MNDVPYDVISGVIAGLQKVYPHFYVMPHGLVHESEEKLRAHFLHTGTPSATGLDGLKSYHLKSYPTLHYTVIYNYGNPYEKWNIFVARPHLWLQLSMVKPEIMLCETVLNLSTLNTLTYLRTY